MKETGRTFKDLCGPQIIHFWSQTLTGCKMPYIMLYGLGMAH